MIILVDSRKKGIRLCVDSEEFHFFDFAPGQAENLIGRICFLSDVGFNVVVSGKEMEDCLDKHNVYYLHLENEPKENFKRFVFRLKRLIKDNASILDISNSNERLVFGVTKDFKPSTKINSALNTFTVIKNTKDNKFYMTFNIPAEIEQNYIKLVKYFLKLEKMLFNWYKNSHYKNEKKTQNKMSIDSLYDALNLTSGDSIEEIIAKLDMIATLKVLSF